MNSTAPETNKAERILSESFAQVFRAYLEASDQVQAVIRDMCELINCAETDPDDREAAVETLTAELAQRLGLGKSVKGVLIVEVHPDSDAYEKGLREGMVVTHVGWNEIGTAGQFADVISSKDAAKGVTLRVVKSGGRSELIFITVMGE